MIPLRFPEFINTIRPQHRQSSFLKLLLNNFPPTKILGHIHRRPSLRVNAHVGQLVQLAALLDRFVDLACWLWLDNRCEEPARGLNVEQFGVGDLLARELEDTLGNLDIAVELVSISPIFVS